MYCYFLKSKASMYLFLFLLRHCNSHYYLCLSGTQCTVSRGGSNCIINMGCCMHMWILASRECMYMLKFWVSLKQLFIYISVPSTVVHMPKFDLLLSQGGNISNIFMFASEVLNFYRWLFVLHGCRNGRTKSLRTIICIFEHSHWFGNFLLKLIALCCFAFPNDIILMQYRKHPFP